MAKDGPSWEGLLKWSLAHSDGTRPTSNLSEEDRRWFVEAIQAHSVDVVKRMKEITLVMKTPEKELEAQGVTPAEIEDLLDELQEHVESIDMANDLDSIGGLAPLLDHLKNSHANIRAKAADVVTTIVQNNPRSQELVMRLNGFERLFSSFTSDPDVNVRAKALGAISSLIRHNKVGSRAFRLANGYGSLKEALSSGNVRFQRKALNLIHYLLQENISDCTIVRELGFPPIMMQLASNEDADVREAALRGLLELARNKKDGAPGIFGENDKKMKKFLKERIKRIVSMSAEDLAAAREERQLVDSLWNTCSDEPSNLRKKGLVVLPGEDAPPPDVASEHFEPPLRAWAVNPNSNKDSGKENRNTPLLLGPGPPPANH